MLNDRLASRVDTEPNAIAIVYGARRISYAALWSDIDIAARALAERGVGPGSVVALLSDNTPEFITTYFAIARHGAVAVPLNTSFKEQELATCIQMSQATLLRVSPRFDVRVRAALQRIGGEFTPEVPRLRGPNAAARQHGEGFESFRREGGRDASSVSSDGSFICLFSSGSTGRPKRLLRTQQNYLAEVDGYSRLIGLSSSDRTLCAIPLYHSYAIGNCFLPSLLTGGQLILPAPLDENLAGQELVHQRMAQLFTMMEEERVTIFPNVPYVFRAMAEYAQATPKALATLRHCFSSGNFLPREIYDEFLARFGLSIRSIYGCSEAGTVSINMADGAHFDPASAGTLLDGYEVRVLRSDDDSKDQARDEVLPAGVVGEISFRGPGLTAGYPDLPELSAAAFRDGFFRTGDLGRIAEDGTLTIVGRAKLLIDTGGRKVDPFEVEDVLRTHPAIREAVVLGVPTAKGNEIVKAAVVLTSPLAKEDVKAFCAERLSDYKVPRIVEVLEEIPKTPTGKILRKELIRPGDAVHELRELLLDIVRQGLDEIDTNAGAKTSFAALGIDSVTIVELNALLGEYFPGLSKTLFFEHGNFRDVVAHLESKHAPEFAALRARLREEDREGESRPLPGPPTGEADATAVATTSSRNEVREEDIAIIGLAGVFPDADDLEMFWSNLLAGHDSIREIPPERWRVDDHFDARRGVVGKTYGRWGGFIRDVETFDPLFFSIAPRDAALMDPQERLFLQTAYHALEDAGHTRATLAGETVGVYVGVMHNEYQLLAAENGNGLVATSLYASIANRLSYFSGFHGPSMAIDTMCSSSLTALFLACENIQRGHASVAVVGGVNLSLHPIKYLQTAQGNFLASDGRCRSFGEGGDGYVPGEGVAALVLKPLSRAIADRDRIRGVIAATAVNHGGRANGFTVPSPNAQADVIADAMRRAGLAAADIDYVEAHGTGTQLGDPIELTGLTKAFESAGGRETPCALGSVKSNIGHLEAAAGVAGIAKVLLQFEHEMLVPSLHSRRLNPNLDFGRSPFAVQRELSSWPKKSDGRPRVACVSSFGAGGSNAHVVLREPPDAAFAPETQDACAVVLSAKDETSLQSCVDRWIAWLARTDAPLASIAYTSQLGREPLEQRLAVVCRSKDELLETLRAWRHEPEGSPNATRFAHRVSDAGHAWAGSAKVAFVRFLVEQRELGQLAECWTEGADVPWQELHGDAVLERVNLPLYPFAKERCWIAPSKRAAEPAAHIAIYEPRWEKLTGSPREAKALLDAICLVPSVEWGEAFVRASHANPGFASLSYLVPDAECPVAEWKAGGDDAAALLVTSDSHGTVVIDLLDGPRADADSLPRAILEVHRMRTALQAARVRLSSWTLALRDEHAASAALSGLAPVISRDLAGVPARTLRFPHDGSISTVPASILANLNLASVERETRLTQGTREALAMHPLEGGAPAPVKLHDGAVYVITGGLGGLGIWIAEVLASKAPIKVCLLGRSPLDASRAEKIENLVQRRIEVEYHAVDVADENEVARVLAGVRARHGAIRGVVHCAGIADVDPGGLPALDRSARTLRPKVQGTMALDAATASDDLDFFLVFASTAAWLGDFGQGAYAVGNRFQVEFARERNARAGRGERRGHTCAIGWPLFRDGGMHLDRGAEELYLRSAGLRHLERPDAARCVDIALATSASSLLVLAGAPDAVARIARMSTTIGERAPEPPPRSAGVPSHRAAAIATKGPSIEERLRRWASEISGIETHRIETNTNLGTYGFDSVSLAKFAQRISAELAIELAPTVFFAHASLGALAKHLVESYAVLPMDDAPAPHVASAFDATVYEAEAPAEAEPVDDSAIAIIGMSARLPGAPDIDVYWRNLIANEISIREIPAERWDLGMHHGEHVPEELRTEAKWGGFIEGVDTFDARFFRISPREAEEMDPQHRLFLAACWHALEDAGYDPLSLAGRRVGVFAGVQFKDYEQLLTRAARSSAQVSSGNAHALLPNRVSYLLDFHGPSESVDTACSSSLVAFHRGAEALRRGEAEVVLVGGVSLMLDPHTYIGASQLGVLSPDGRCKTFDRGANGYVRGEGVGVVVLKPLGQAVRDGDPIYAVVRATAVNHGGRANSLTAPNSSAQAALIVDACERARFEPESIGYIEAHGTGTSLGDPIEVEGIQSAFAQLATRRGRPLEAERFCALGSAKPNIGHLEPAAGIAGVIKTVLALKHATLPGNPALFEPNPYLKVDSGPVYLLRETVPWPEPRERARRRAGVSSFGYGGTNAHAALEEWPQTPRAISPSARPVIFALSARDTGALERYVARHVEWIERHRERLGHVTDFHDYVFTCQTARTAMKERLAFVVQSASELEAGLRAFLRGEPCGGARGSVEARPDADDVEPITLDPSRPRTVAETWARGERIDWVALWPADEALAPRRTRIPVYPFAPTRYWLESQPVALAKSAMSLPTQQNEPMNATTLDRVLVELASEISKVPVAEISLQESMRELGFESLTMIEYCRRASAKLGVEVKPDIFFELASPTLSALSDRIRERFGDSVRLVTAQPSAAPPVAAAAEPESIAIIGMSGILPGSADLDAFWQNLVDGKNLIGEVPAERWDYREYLGDPRTERNRSNVWLGGFIPGVEEFDAKFFGISPKEAELMDPQQRLFLTTVWRAVEDAGYRASDLGKRRTGLFVGVSSNDYQELARDYDVDVDAYSVTGIAHSVLANRISYFLDITGPSEPVDTACSASLIAVHRAVEQLQSNQCDIVIAGGVNVILSPRLYVSFGKAGMLSPEGKCRTFDRAANGYVRGEGVGALVLKRLRDAERDGDTIHAVIRGSATNHGGRANSLTAPNVRAQTELLESAYARAGVDPATVTYIEAHGTGTPLGDPVEVNGIKRAFTALHARWNRVQDADVPRGYCGLGSVKTNVGHLETAAGIAGLFKVVLAMRHGVLPGQLHFEQLNPLIDLKDSPFFVVDEMRPWRRLVDDDGQEIPRRAGVSGFGFGGANAHVVLEEYVAPKAPREDAHRAALIPLSARTEEALAAYADALLAWLERRRTAPSGRSGAETDPTPWLLAQAAEALGVRPEDVDPNEDLRDYGLEATGLRRLLNALREGKDPSFTWSMCGGVYSVARVAAALERGHRGETRGLHDIAFTLQQGREAFEHRLVLECASLRELEEKLREGLRHGTDGVWCGRASAKGRDRAAQAEHDERAKRAVAEGRLRDVAELWIEGADVPWALLEGAGSALRISLPTYPFARDRHWLTPSDAPKAAVARTETAAATAETDEIGNADVELVLAATQWTAHAAPTAPAPRAGDVVVAIGLDAALERELRAHVESNGGAYVAVRSADWTASEPCARQLDAITADLGTPTHIVHAGGEGALRELFFLAQALMPRGAMRICHVYSLAATNAVASEAIVGFAQALRVENPRLQMSVLGLDANAHGRAEDVWAALAGRSPASGAERIGAKGWQSLTLTELPRSNAFDFRTGGVYVITGGASGLGLMFARYLAREHRAKLVLLGRSGLSAARRAKLAELERLGAEVLYLEADVAEKDSLEAALAKARARFGVLHGVLHSAGVTRDSFLTRKSWADLDEVLAPKVSGTQYLDEVLRDEPLDFFVMFSSITALLGNVGQVDYAYANAYLHAFAERRDALRRAGQRSGRTLALAWQFWGDDGGMVTNEQARRWMWKQSGIVALHEQVGIRALREALAGDAHVVATFYGDAARIRQRFTDYSGWLAETSGPKPRATKEVSRADVEAYLTRLVAAASKTDIARVEAAEPLETYGLDSMMIASLNRSLEEDFGDLPKTLFFEYQTIRELAGYFVGEHADRVARAFTPKEDAEATAPSAALEREAFAIVGIAGRYPGAANVRELWENLLRGEDCVVEIPEDRWDHSRVFDENKRAKGKTYGRWGGFIDDIDKFDARYFGIAPVEAKFMDPQERIFLEIATEALQDAGYNRAAVRGTAMGVFVGVTYSHYQLYGAEETERGNPTVLGASYSSIANRVSYYYDLRGPSMAIDTMCSSSLTALHGACRALWAGDCDAAIVGGTNLSVHPHKYVSLSDAHFLSTDGRCRAFGEGGDGYVPGEGIGAVLIKRLSKAERDGDHVYGIIRGISINHGGKTNGYSVPNPRAQSEVVASAWREAGITARDIGYVEAHGTGTALGDPIEIAALTAAFAQHTKERGFCPIGSIKANVGHLEATAGVIGLTKVLLQMKHETLVPSIHSDPPNPNLDFAATPFVVQRDIAAWPRAQRPRIGVVSSFGAGGSNAHVVVQDVAERATQDEAAGPFLFVCSARTEEQLRTYTASLEGAIRAAAVRISDVCRTLQAGRDEQPHRLAIVARDRNALLGHMAAYLAGRPIAESTWTGTAPKAGGQHREESAEPSMLAWLRGEELAHVAEAWVTGAYVPWGELASHRGAGRISLPTYPFARERHWFTSTERATVTAPRPAFLPEPARPALAFEVHDPIVREHVVQERYVVPGVALLNAALAHAVPPVALRRFAWLKPVIVTDARVEVRVEPSARNGNVVQLVSESSGTLIVHARWEVAAETGSLGGVDVSTLQTQLRRIMTPDALYEAYARRGIVYGPSFRRIVELHADADQVLARIEGPPRRPSGAFHVQTMDAALQGIAVLAEAASGIHETHVPFAIGKARWQTAPAGDVWAHIRRRAPGSYDVRVADASGRICLALEDFSTRALQGEAREAPRPSAPVNVDRLFYRPTWISLPTH